MLWQKERLLNLALQALPSSCRKVAWVDCDVVFAAGDWLERTSHLLDHFTLVQPFSHLHRMPPDWAPGQAHRRKPKLLQLRAFPHCIGHAGGDVPGHSGLTDPMLAPAMPGRQTESSWKNTFVRCLHRWRRRQRHGPRGLRTFRGCAAPSALERGTTIWLGPAPFHDAVRSNVAFSREIFAPLAWHGRTPPLPRTERRARALPVQPLHRYHRRSITGRGVGIPRSVRCTSLCAIISPRVGRMVSCLGGRDSGTAGQTGNSLLPLDFCCPSNCPSPSICPRPAPAPRRRLSGGLRRKCA